MNNHASSSALMGSLADGEEEVSRRTFTPHGHRVLLTVSQFCEKHPAFPVGGIRNLIFLSEDRRTSAGVIKGNGLKAALIRIGRKILIDETKFFEWLDVQQGGTK